MRPFGRKIHWPTKALSNRNYLNEVSIDGKKTSRFNFRFGYYDLYAAQVMRAGNCLTLLSSQMSFSVEHFQNSILLEDVVKYVFWTFNESFSSRLTDYISQLTQAELQTLKLFLEENKEAYQSINQNSADEELVWCLVKNEHLKADPKFALIYQKDTENRGIILEAVIEKMKAFEKKDDNIAISPAAIPAKTQTGFLDMLQPFDDNVQNTLQYMQSKIIEANFPHNIFLPQPKDGKGRNLVGLNSEIATMIYLFQEKGYYKTDFTFKEIFRAFGIYSGNSSGKDYDYSHFNDDYRFAEYLKLLRSVDIKQR